MFYIYVRNWKIMWNSKSDKLNLWKPFPVELPWYYRLVDWVPKMTTNESDFDPKIDYFVWDRNRKEYRQKRMEATWKESPEDTRWWPLKEETEEETDENPTPENHSESEE